MVKLIEMLIRLTIQLIGLFLIGCIVLWYSDRPEPVVVPDRWSNVVIINTGCYSGRGFTRDVVQWCQLNGATEYISVTSY